MRKRRSQHDFEQEIKSHLELEADQLAGEGLTAEEARTRALRAFGNRTAVAERFYESGRALWLDHLKKDTRYALRMIARTRGSSLAIVLVLALGLGVNAAVFSVFRDVLLRPFPYNHPSQLVRLFESTRFYPRYTYSPPDFRDYRAASRTLTGMAAYIDDAMEFGGDHPQRVDVLKVTEGFFDILHVPPLLGRTFLDAECRDGHDHVVVLSYHLWQAQFAGDSGVLGKVVHLDGTPYQVIGVMPPTFRHIGGVYHSPAFGDTVDGWRPLVIKWEASNRAAHWLNVIGRLKPGVSLQQAQSEAELLAAQRARQYEQDRDWSAVVVPLADTVVGSVRPMLWTLLGAVTALLLLACLNVASLTLARTTVRSEELAVRSALGAPRSRLVMQLLTENVVLALGGGALACIFAAASLDMLHWLNPRDLPRLSSAHFDAALVIFALGLAVVAGLIVGILPARRASRIDLNDSLKDRGRSSSGAQHRRTHRILIAVQLSLAFVLLIATGLLLRSLLNILHTDRGFRTDHVLTMSIELPKARYASTDSLSKFYAELVRRVSSLPGVQSAGVSSDIPWTGYEEDNEFTIEGRVFPPHDGPTARAHFASPGYFEALGIPLLSGRGFAPTDDAKAPKVVIINEALARKYFGNENPVGKRVSGYDNPKPDQWWSIIGVIADIKDGPTAAEAQPALYGTAAQFPDAFAMMVVRTDRDPTQFVAPIRREVRAIDSQLAVADIKPMQEIVSDAVASNLFLAMLVSVFGALALVVACVGIYGVMSLSVAERKNEIGIRVALGASPGIVRTTVLREGMAIVLRGLIVGAALAVIATAIMRSIGGASAETHEAIDFTRTLLYKVPVADISAYAIITVFFISVTTAAILLPANRAAATDPLQVLRQE